MLSSANQIAADYYRERQQVVADQAPASPASSAPPI